MVRAGVKRASPKPARCWVRPGGRPALGALGAPSAD